MVNAKLTLLSIALFVLHGYSQAQAQQTVGLFQNDPGAFDGYTLFGARDGTQYLIDMEGRLVHSWSASGQPPQLLENGNLLLGRGGVHEIAWDGTVVWDYTYSTQHHDYELLPNGNVLMITRESKTYEEAVAAGRNPALVEETAGLRPLHVIEVAPTVPTGGTIVWEWHAWDHLIQDSDSSKANYGVVADHPELIDANWPGSSASSNWFHTNAIHYNPALDQIILSSRVFNELWIIDHSTTTAQAAGHTGGNSDQGGDLLYRWGNPEAYRAGTALDQMLFLQHDAQWIEPQLLGGDNILVFNNGSTARPYSSVDEIVPPVNGYNYWLTPGSPYGPAGPVWSYVAPVPTDFYASFISGTQRLPNGNTLINDGPHGTFFEVTPEGETVWKYVNPVTSTGLVYQGDPIPPRVGGGTGLDNAVFRCYRYGTNYPGLDGRDLTPGDPIEIYTRPLPVPDGAAGTDPMTSSRLTGTGDRISIDWDAASCTTQDYNLIFGNLADVSTYALQGSVCAIGGTGFYDWQGVPPGDLFFLIVGVEETGVYESSWGTDDTGVERHGTAPSSMCGVTSKDSSMSCP
jgi:hypothetical protein